MIPAPTEHVQSRNRLHEPEDIVLCICFVYILLDLAGVTGRKTEISFVLHHFGRYQVLASPDDFLFLRGVFVFLCF